MDYNLVISICAIIIALLSLVATIWNGIITRKHNRLSIKPFPDILISNYEDKIAVTLENKGTGPLIIKSFRAFVGNESKSNIIDWMPNLPEGNYWSDYLRDFENTTFKPFETKPLVEFSLDIRDAKQTQLRDKIRKALADVSIEFDYSDIYNTKMYYPLHFLSSTFGKYKVK